MFRPDRAPSWSKYFITNPSTVVAAMPHSSMELGIDGTKLSLDNSVSKTLISASGEVVVLIVKIVCQLRSRRTSNEDFRISSTENLGYLVVPNVHVIKFVWQEEEVIAPSYSSRPEQQC